MEATMDFKAILPLLLAGNKNADKIMPLISAMSKNGEQNDKNPEQNTSNDKNSSQQDAVLGNKNAAMAQLLKNAMSNERRKNSVFGIEHIAGVANDEILGKMVKYIENNRPGAKKGRK